MPKEQEMPKTVLEDSVLGSKLDPIPVPCHVNEDDVDFKQHLVRCLEENNEMDPDLKYFLLNYFERDDDRAESNKRRVEKDEEDHNNNGYDEGVNDPQYELFLQKLKCDDDGKSYVFEGEENGSPFFVKYEQDSSSDKECDVEPPRRILRSATNRKNGASNHILRSQSTPSKASEKPMGRKLRNSFGSEKGKNVKSSTDKTAWEHDYVAWHQDVVEVDGCHVLKHRGRMVVYEEHSNVRDEYNDRSSSDVEFLGSTLDKERRPNIMTFELKDEENNSEKEDENECSSDVEILETPFNKKEENQSFSMMNDGRALDTNDTARFRKKVIAALRKPYNREEYNSLLKEAEFQRPEERHLELRYGRERSYSVKKDGKSYLDHYPELQRKLVQVPNDKLRRLNLLRGFFVWLEQPGPFCPWKDPECLAIKPGSPTKASSSYRGFSRC